MPKVILGGVMRKWLYGIWLEWRTEFYLRILIAVVLLMLIRIFDPHSFGVPYEWTVIEEPRDQP
jgi:hypothetical protein